jgi:hypothetical protein
MDYSKFLIKVWNYFTQEREVSCVLVASYLLSYEAYYMPYKKTKSFNLKTIKRRVHSIAALSRPDRRANSAHNTEFLFFEP